MQKKDYDNLTSLVKHFSKDPFEIELITGNGSIVGASRLPEQP